MSREDGQVTKADDVFLESAVPSAERHDSQDQWPYVGSMDVASRGISVHWRVPHYLLWVIAVANTVLHCYHALQETILAWVLFLLWATRVRRPRMGRWEFRILFTISLAALTFFTLAVLPKYWR